MQTVLIFGGTGSLGSQLTNDFLALDYRVIVVSRSEYKQFVLANKHWLAVKQGKLKLVLGDIRNIPALYSDVNYVINAAALKHVSICQDNPHEAFGVNVLGNQNVINYVLQNNIKRAIYIGTDKAVHPINTYGTTKLIAERDWNAANEKKSGSFVTVRLGNLFGSSGSVAELFVNQQSSKFKISSMDSWRYFLPIKAASQMIIDIIHMGQTPDYLLSDKPMYRQYKKMRIVDLVYACCDKPEIEIVGLREGEKLYEEFETVIESSYYTIDEIKEMIKEYKASL
jgi:UDP-N-acetylglucosamine 4,6-dehydratase